MGDAGRRARPVGDGPRRGRTVPRQLTTQVAPFNWAEAGRVLVPV